VITKGVFVAQRVALQIGQICLTAEITALCPIAELSNNCILSNLTTTSWLYVRTVGNVLGSMVATGLIEAGFRLAFLVVSSAHSLIRGVGKFIILMVRVAAIVALPCVSSIMKSSLKFRKTIA
jgi:hypothetical protein